MLYKLFYLFLILISISIKLSNTEDEESCNASNNSCNEFASPANDKYAEFNNTILANIQAALNAYIPCSSSVPDSDCDCHAAVIERDLAPYKSTGVTRQMLTAAAKYGTRYKIYKKRLYRETNCMFPARCTGIEHFLLKLLPVLPNIDLVINTRDWPQLNAAWGLKGPVFSFSKTNEYLDIMYPAWTFWAGGPAISLHPTGIGRWDLMRQRLHDAAAKLTWAKKQSIGFFRGSRTSDERDALILLSRQKPKLIDAQYTKNQAWKSPKDTLDAPPAQEVSFESHCNYKYLFNFRGVAASFRLKHLFLCKSLVFHVGEEWQEFFYAQLKPWVHYVPLHSYPNQMDIEKLVSFFLANDKLAEQIAARGYEFIWHHLRMEDVTCYWRKLLKKYAKLLKFEVKPDNELIEIGAKNNKEL